MSICESVRKGVKIGRFMNDTGDAGTRGNGDGRGRGAPGFTEKVVKQLGDY